MICLEFGSGDPNNEPVAESHEDESTYAGIHTSFALEGRPMPAGEKKIDQTEEEDYANS